MEHELEIRKIQEEKTCMKMKLEIDLEMKKSNQEYELKNKELMVNESDKLKNLDNKISLNFSLK